MEGESGGARAAAAGLSLNVTPVEAGQIFSSRQAAKMAAETELAAVNRSIKSGKGAGSRQIHVVCRNCTTWFVKGCAQRTGEFKIAKVGKDHANCVEGGRTDSNGVQPMVGLEVEELMFWCSLAGGADRPPEGAMTVAIACLEQEDLGFGFLCWERKVIRADKIADGRVPLPARSGYISENRGTVLGKSRRGRVYPAVFRTRQGESGRQPISCVRFTL